MLRIAILDDYQNVALESADWSPLVGSATLTVFNDHLSDANEIVERPAPWLRNPTTRRLREQEQCSGVEFC